MTFPTPDRASTNSRRDIEDRRDAAEARLASGQAPFLAAVEGGEPMICDERERTPIDAP